MSEGVILAVITVIGAPLIGFVVYLARETYNDNRESWKQRAESSEAREREMKDEVFPAVKDLVDGVKSLAEGQAKDREFWRQALPALERVERTLERTYTKKGERDEG